MNNPTPQSFHPADQLRYHKNRRLLLGAFIIMAGIFVLAKKLGLPFIHYPIWPIVLIVVGIISGIKHNFRRPFSYILIIIGVLHLIPRFTFLGILSTQFVFPLILIALGLYVIFKPNRRFGRFSRFGYHHRERFSTATIVDEDTVALDVAFGERTSIITTKNFKGGTIDTTFGSVKLNLLQAEGQSPIIIDTSVSFGSLEVYVPSHWDVAFEIENNFASVEDNRYMRTQAEVPVRLVLKGKCNFGSVSVKSI